MKSSPKPEPSDSLCDYLYVVPKDIDNIIPEINLLLTHSWSFPGGKVLWTLWTQPCSNDLLHLRSEACSGRRENANDGVETQTGSKGMNTRVSKKTGIDLKFNFEWLGSLETGAFRF